MATAFAFISEPAGADPAPLSDGSWFWADQQSPPPNTVSAGLPAAGVPAADYAVAVRGGQSNKETFIHLDMSGFPESGTVSSFILTLKEDGPPAVNINAASAKISALPVGDFWAGGAAGAPYSQRPTVLEGPAVAGTRADDGTWTFDISPIVSGWLSGTMSDNGVVLVPANGLAPSDNFEVVWLGSSVHADGSITDDSSSDSTSVAATGSDFSSTDTQSGSTTDSAVASDTASTTGGDFSTPLASSTPTLTDSSPTLGSDVAAAPPAAATPAPAPAPAATPTQRVAASKKSDTTPPWVVWPIAIGFGALLVGIGLSLGPMGEPAPPRRGSVIRRLERPIGAP